MSEHTLGTKSSNQPIFNVQASVRWTGVLAKWSRPAHLVTAKASVLYMYLSTYIFWWYEFWGSIDTHLHMHLS